MRWMTSEEHSSKNQVQAPGHLLQRSMLSKEKNIISEF